LASPPAISSRRSANAALRVALQKLALERAAIDPFRIPQARSSAISAQSYLVY
jgi:hypothetical protein